MEHARSLPILKAKPSWRMVRHRLARIFHAFCEVADSLRLKSPEFPANFQIGGEMHCDGQERLISYPQRHGCGALVP